MIRNMLVIDAHCHIYPPKIAGKAAEGTARFYDTKTFYDGTVASLIADGRESAIDGYVVQSVATAPKQVSSINRFIAEEVRKSGGRLFGLGTLHPYSPTLERDVEELVRLGLHGVKLHPDIQKVRVDDPCCMKIYELCRGKLPILIHTGDKRYDYSNPNRLVPVLKAFPDLTVIGAHLGGYSVWDDAYDKLKGIDNLFFDCCSSLTFLDRDKAAEIIRGYGTERVMFGSDYPMWSPKIELDKLMALGLKDSEYDRILGKNALRIYNWKTGPLKSSGKDQ